MPISPDGRRWHVTASGDGASAAPHWLAKKERQMTPEILRDHIAKLSVETVDQLTERDIHELSDAAASLNS